MFVFLVLQVVPPMIKEFEHLGSKVPGYVHDFEQWANQNQQFQELNHKYDITQTLQEQASSSPPSSAARASDDPGHHRQHPRAPDRRDHDPRR